MTSNMDEPKPTYTATDYILAGTPAGEHEVVFAHASVIQLGYGSIMDVVNSMEDYVSSDNLIHQAKSIEYLAAVLDEFAKHFMDRREIKPLVKFLSDRFTYEGVPGMKESAVGLHILATMNNFDSNDSVGICQDIFMNIDTFNQNPAVARVEVYKLISLLVNFHAAGLRRMDGVFIKSLLSLAELEKDPRCLMPYFSTLQVILTAWDIKGHVNDLWEAVSKYFPITFRAKPDDPIGITAEDLKLQLRMCIAGTTEFAPQAFPYLIAKLDFQVTGNVKKDVIQTLTACVKAYGLPTISTWSSQLWEALKFEVLNASEEDLADEALTALQAIATQLSHDNLTLQKLERTSLFRFIDVIAKECVKHLHEPQLKYSKQSGQIIGKVASGSPFAFHLIVKGIFPELITIIQDTLAITKKKELLEVLNMVLDSRMELVQSEEFSAFPALGILDAVSESCAVGTIAHGGLTFFRDFLFEIFSVTLTNSPPQEISIRMTAVRGLLKLVKLPKFLTRHEVGMIIQYFDQLVVDKYNTRNDLREDAILALQEIAELHPQEVTDITFSAFLGALPKVLGNDNVSKDYLPIMEALARIGSGDRLFPIFVRRLNNKLDDVVRNSNSQAYAHAILAGILYAIQQREAATQFSAIDHDGRDEHVKTRYSQQQSQYLDVVKHLYRDVTILCTYTDGPYCGKQYIGVRAFETVHGSVYPDDTFLDLVGKIGMTAVRSMNVDDQTWAASQIFTLFAEFPSGKSEESVRQTQFDLVNATSAQKRILTLSMHLLAGLRREVELGFDPYQVCCKLISGFGVSQRISWEPLDSISGFAALLINKWNGNISTVGIPLVDKFPQLLLTRLLNSSLDSMQDHQVANFMRMTVLFTMASNLKDEPATTDLLKILVDLLSNKKHGSRLAKEFKYIIAPSELLSKENFALFRRLYKQRPYAVCVPRIIDLFKACTDTGIRGNYLVALSAILKYTSTDFILPEIELLLPVLLQSMDALGSNVKAASIDVLRTAIVESPNSVEGHLHSIIHRLFDRIQNTLECPSDSPSAVRVMALKCLGAVPVHLNRAIALRYKMETLRELEYALNDVKRNVRDEAVRCRFAWFNLAEDSENSDQN